MKLVRGAVVSSCGFPLSAGLAGAQPLPVSPLILVPGEEHLGRVKSVEPVPWRHTKECGVNCLYVLMRMRGVEVSHQAVKSEVAMGERGATLAELGRVARLYGFPMTPVRASPSTIGECPLPI